MIPGRFSRVDENGGTHYWAHYISKLRVFILVFDIEDDQQMELYTFINVWGRFKSNTIKDADPVFYFDSIRSPQPYIFKVGNLLSFQRVDNNLDSEYTRLIFWNINYKKKLKILTSKLSGRRYFWSVCYKSWD